MRKNNGQEEESDDRGGQFNPTGSGVISQVTWLADPLTSGNTLRYGGYKLSGDATGGVLVISSNYTGQDMTERKGQHGWRWYGTEWPDSFQQSMCNSDGFPSAVRWETEEWFEESVLSLPSATWPTQTIQKVWSMTQNSEQLGYLIRYADRSLGFLARTDKLDAGRLKKLTITYTLHSGFSYPPPAGWSFTRDKTKSVVLNNPNPYLRAS